MTKQEEDKIKEELNKALSESKKSKKAAGKTEKKPAARKTSDAKAADTKTADTKASSGKSQKKTAEKKPAKKKAPDKKPAAAVVVPSAEESETPAVVHRGRAGSRSKERGSRHEKAEPVKKEKPAKKEKAAMKEKPAKKEKAAKEDKPAKKAKAEKKSPAKKTEKQAPAHEAASDKTPKHGDEIRTSGARKWAVLTAVLLAILMIVLVVVRYTTIVHKYTRAYIAGTSKDAAVYAIGQNEDEDKTGPGEAVEVERIVRGTPVKRYADKVRIDDVTYCRIDKTVPGQDISEGQDIIEEDYDKSHAIYVREDNLVRSEDDIVQEDEVYVRTPVTVYSEETGPAIKSFAPKGSLMEVLGFDKLNPDGSIHKYHVKFTDPNGERVKGYVYGKYMVDSQEKADAAYNANGIADKVAKDNYGYDLYGGKAADLDYYPFEKPEIKGNEFCSYARAMYINCEAAVNYKPWVNLIKESGANAAVIDIKDGVLAYESEVAKEMSPSSYKTAYVSKDEYRKGVEAYKEAGVYLIGRIVVFNDPIYAKDHPENCISYDGSTDWPSAYSRGVWEYNVRLAQEAIKEFGFDEIQFDYVRFPENSFEMSKSGAADFRNLYGEEKGQAVQNFCMYAADQIHDSGAYFSVDVFGESAYGYMTAYGQYWAGISNVVDAISAMPYTDHMGVDLGWEDPYGIMYNWGKRAQKQQDKLEQPAVARTWITGYDTPHWAPSFDYGTAELKAQVQGLEDAGLTGGFIPWNGVSSIEKYTEYQEIWHEN